MASSSQGTTIWSYVHCSVCMVYFLPPNHLNDPTPTIPFWVTDCGHVVCNNHLKPDRSCAACGTTGISCVPLQQRNMSSPISQWFDPITDSHEKLALAASIQYNMLVELIEYYKKKYETAKMTISQLHTQVESLQLQLQSEQNYQSASHALVDQRPIHDSGYSSGHSGGFKRRRVDIGGGEYQNGQGGSSSPHSSHAPATSGFDAGVPVVTRRSGPAANSRMHYEGQRTTREHNVGQVQSGQVRNLNAQQYAYIPPSTPLNAQPPGHSIQAQSRNRLAPEINDQRAPSRGAVLMPPPAIPTRQFGTPAVAPVFGQNAGRTSTATNQAAGRFRPASTPRPAQQGGGAAGSRTLFAAAGDGRRFMPGM